MQADYEPITKEERQAARLRSMMMRASDGTRKVSAAPPLAVLSLPAVSDPFAPSSLASGQHCGSGPIEHGVRVDSRKVLRQPMAATGIESAQPAFHRPGGSRQSSYRRSRQGSGGRSGHGIVWCGRVALMAARRQGGGGRSGHGVVWCGRVALMAASRQGSGGRSGHGRGI